MLALKNIPIKRKLMLISMFTSCVALLLACAAFVTYDQIIFRRSMVLDLSITAEMIGSNCAASLSFSEPTSAEDTLKSLAADPHIMAACIYDKAGQVFATYSRDNQGGDSLPPRSRANGHAFGKRDLGLFRQIIYAGEPIGSVYIQSDLWELQDRLQQYASIVCFVFLTSVLAAFVLSSKLQRLISAPIFHLAKTANTVATERNYSVRAVKHGQDELGLLIDGFNEMLAQIQAQDNALQLARDHLEQRVQERTQDLEAAHKQLVETSRQAGMAEVATAVLHNVGNVLNSVNVSASLVMDSIRKSKVPGLARAVGLMDEHSANLCRFLTDDPKGKQLPDYLKKLAEHLSGEQALMLKELGSLCKNIEHIKDIVSMQQAYARVSGVVEPISATELVEDALRMNAGALTRHDVQVIRELDEIPKVSVEKHKVLQILVNLISNAKYALDEGNPPVKLLTLKIGMNGNNHFQIAVRDNGVGIPAQSLARIFAHGFTTKTGGHGFGLHSGALAAMEMGGTLQVHSEGVGQGATFTLDLPLKPGANSNG
jgi:signal transduction histidine kinase